MKTSQLNLIVKKFLPNLRGNMRLAIEDVLIHGRDVSKVANTYNLFAEYVRGNCNKIVRIHNMIVGE